MCCVKPAAVNVGLRGECDMIRAIVFDLDGTLFDRATSVQRCIEAQYYRCAQALFSMTREAYVLRFLELDARGYTPKDTVYSQLSSEFSLPPGSSELLYTDFYAHYHRHAIGFPNLQPTLRRLREQGVSLGIVTNGSESHQRATIRALEIESYFDAILVSEAEGVRKPDPRIFRRVCERLHVTPAETIYVGDHPEVDIEGARSSGLWSVWRRDPYWGECLSADAIIDDLSEVPSLLVQGRLSASAVRGDN